MSNFTEKITQELLNQKEKAQKPFSKPKKTN